MRRGGTKKKKKKKKKKKRGREKRRKRPSQTESKENRRGPRARSELTPYAKIHIQPPYKTPSLDMNKNYPAYLPLSAPGHSGAEVLGIRGNIQGKSRKNRFT